MDKDGEVPENGSRAVRPLGGLLVALLAIGLIESVSATTFRLDNIAPFLMVSVVAAAALFGIRAGMLCALACFAFATYDLSRPEGSFVYTAENMQRVVVLAVLMPITAVIVGLMRRKLDRQASAERKSVLLQTRLEEREKAEIERAGLLERAEASGRDLRRALDTLEAKDLQLRLLTDALPVLISYADPSHRYTFCNRAYEQWFGIRIEDLVGRHMSEVLGEKGYQTVRPRIEAALAGQEQIFETWIEYRESSRYIQATYIPDKVAGGPVRGVAIMVSDLTERKRDEDAQRFIASASEELNRSLDYETTLSAVARLAVPRVADWCAVDVLDGGERKRIAVAHVDPEKVAWASEIERKYPPDEGAPQGVPEVLRSGRSEIYPDIPDEMLAAAAQSEEHLRLIRELGMCSAMVVPIKTSEEVMGAITFVSAESGRRYADGDLVLAETLASRAALAMQNAKLYRAAQHEIEDRKKAEAALSESQRIFSMLADSAPVLIWMTGADGNTNYVNKPWFDFTGRTPEQEYGDGWTQGVHPEDRDMCLDIFNENFQARRKFAMEFRLRRYDGMYRWVFDTGVPRFQSDGTFLGFIGSLIDITDRKLNEEEIKRLNENLEARVIARTQDLRHANEELEAFSYSVSHDLRAPLRSISSYSRILMEDYAQLLDDDGKDSLNRIRAASQRMANLIDDMLKFARLAKTELNPEVLDLSAIAQTFAEELRRRDPSREVRFEIDPGIKAVADRQLLTIVLENLFENAWKFTSRQEDARIEMVGESLDGVTCFQVRDNGIGFDPDFAHKLFVPFERLHGQKDYPGTGIGLSNVKRIIERHGGSISAAGKVGQGASFEIRLPKVARPASADPAQRTLRDS